MCTLLVVRHGQASFGTDNYDVLSPLGIKQSRSLGAWLAKRNISLDAIWAGPQQRQRDTARHLVEAAADEGVKLPEPEILEDLREVPSSLIYQRILPQLESRWHGDECPRPGSAASRVLMKAWANGQADIGDIESFTAFDERIRRVFKRIIDQAAPDQRIAVVTSAGPLAVAVRQALSLGATQSMDINFAAANSGVTEFRLRRQELEIVSFNSVGHLDQEDVTHI